MIIGYMYINKLDPWDIINVSFINIIANIN